MNTLMLHSSYINSRYLELHYFFFLEYAKLAGISIRVDTDDGKFLAANQNQAYISCYINDQLCIIDFNDFWNWKFDQKNHQYFKFQSTTDTKFKCVPLGPPIVGLTATSRRSSIKDYLELRKIFHYNPRNNIMCKQIPGGNALTRRQHVQKMLNDNFDNVVLSSKDNQYEFWSSHENCLAAVCVPGATENMVDRGQMELIGLGVPTISPRLTTRFVHNCLLEPGVHYIECQQDYSDLVEIINSLKCNTEYLKYISQNAWNFFEEHYTPEKYWNWIIENLNESSNKF